MGESSRLGEDGETRQKQGEKPEDLLGLSNTNAAAFHCAGERKRLLLNSLSFVISQCQRTMPTSYRLHSMRCHRRLLQVALECLDLALASISSHSATCQISSLSLLHLQYSGNETTLQELVNSLCDWSISANIRTIVTCCSLTVSTSCTSNVIPSAMP